MTVRLGRLPSVGESLDAGLESPTRQRQVIVARGQGHEAAGPAQDPGLHHRGPLLYPLSAVGALCLPGT